MSDVVHKRLIGPDGLGKILGVSTALVRRMWKEGRIPGVPISRNILRFDPDEVVEALRRTEDSREGKTS